MAGISLRTTMADSVASQLRDDIRSGVIAPGSRLRQIEIAARFNISTTPVREAFAALESEGLLVGSPHRGMIVFRPTVDDLQETYDIRIPLEALATEKSVANITDTEIAELDRILQAMRGVRGNAKLYSELNHQFHDLIYSAARRPKLRKLIADFREASTAYLQLYAAIMPTASETQGDHEAIFAAVKARAPQQAARAMTVHLERTVAHVRRGLQDRATGNGPLT